MPLSSPVSRSVGSRTCTQPSWQGQDDEQDRGLHHVAGCCCCCAHWVEQCRLREGTLQGTAASFSLQRGYLRDLAAVGKRLGECLPDLVLAAKLPAQALHKDGGAVGLPAGCTQRSACR